MLSLPSVSRCSAPSSFLSRKPRALRFLTVQPCSERYSCSNQNQRILCKARGDSRSKSGKLRLDSWISCRISGFSRAPVQSIIKSGIVSVNGKITYKFSHNVKAGDEMDCIILEWKPLRVEPENLPLDIVCEDENVLVVNKPAQMVIAL